MRSSRSLGILNLVLLVVVLACPASALAQTSSPQSETPAATAPAQATTTEPVKAANQPANAPAGPAANQTANQIVSPRPPLSRTTRILALAAGGVVTFLLYFLLSGLHPLQLIVGEDNRYSNSKFQVALWFFVLITTYIATFGLRAFAGVIGQIGIPEHLLLLSGMSAFTYAAAKGITTSKVNDAQARGIADPKNTAASPSLLRNLTHDDGLSPIAAESVVPGGPLHLLHAGRLPSLDLGDAQMVIVTVLAVAVYVYGVLHFMGVPDKLYAVTANLPDVDSTILSIFGLGQGAYITKKAVGNVGQS
jgi:hypothetical protein